MQNKTRKSAYRWKIRYTDLKSIVDRFLALFGILVLSPLLIIVAICVSIDSRGGFLFKQERVGKDGKKFIMYKFRSMSGMTDDDDYRELLQTVVQSDQPHVFYKLSFQPRVTRVGRFLRKTNLDEMPQLFNVLKGEIHLIGPRPDLPYSVEVYEDWMKKRLLVKPGMTGLWQVSGGNHLPFKEMVQLDIEYIERQSVFRDIKILWKTAGLVLSGGGNYWSQNGEEDNRSENDVIQSSN